MDAMLNLLMFCALVYGGPLLLLSLFYIPNYFKVAERREKAKEDLKNSVIVIGQVTDKSTKFGEIPDEAGVSTETHNYFQVNFQINEHERSETIKIVEEIKHDWFTNLFEREKKTSYEANTTKFKAYYNRLNHEIKSLEEITKSLTEHSFIYSIIRFYIFLMLFHVGASIVGVVYGAL
jgi:hypothetical protein